MRVGGLYEVVAGMVVTHVAANLEAARLALGLAVLPRKVQACALRSREAAATAKSARAAEAAVARIVGRAVGRDAALIGEAVHEGAARIAFLSAVGEVYVGNPRLIELALRGNIEHGSFLAIVNARQFRVVALLVVSLDFVDHIGGQVLHRHLRVALEEVFAVYEKLRHGLTVPLHGAVIAHLHTRQLLHEGFKRRAFGHAVGGCVEDGGIFLLFHARYGGGHHGRLERAVERFENDLSHVERVSFLGHIHIKASGLVAHKRHFQNVLPRLAGVEQEGAILGGRLARHHGAVGIEQGGRGQFDGFICLSVRHMSGKQIALRLCTERERSNEQQQEDFLCKRHTNNIYNVILCCIDLFSHTFKTHFLPFGLIFSPISL